jgi:hypothetical protein
VVSFTLGHSTPGKEPRYPLDRRSGGPQSRSGRQEEVKILAPFGFELGYLGRPARSHSLYRTVDWAILALVYVCSIYYINVVDITKDGWEALG